MRFWVVGVGGIGSVVGARLASWHDVTFLDSWPDHVAAINRSGLQVRYPSGDICARAPAYRLDDITDIESSPDAVLLAVKSYETARMCELLAPRLRPDTLVVSLQNCLNEDTIAEAIGWGRTVGAVCLFDGSLDGPGRAHQVRERPLVLGGFTVSQRRPVDALAAALRRSVPVTLTDAIRDRLWSKLVRNTMINAVSAVSGLPLGRLVADPLLVRTCVALGAEAVAVADALGITLSVGELYGEEPAAFLAGQGSPAFARVMDAFRAAYQPYPELRPSMLQDVLKGRRTEVEQLNGYVARKGVQAGCAAPLNTAVTDLVRRVERAELPPGPSVPADVLGPLVGREGPGECFHLTTREES